MARRGEEKAHRESGAAWRRGEKICGTGAAWRRWRTVKGAGSKARIGVMA
jgi:hypothetical protein